ncbi:sensor histidine kinase [Actinomadura gamaensis]|uniref:histidine kinase n=1 Tax=Actinomadura gamaensis TaxID=1763541 RepID=A0ABV9UD60_9ACTN
MRRLITTRVVRPGIPLLVITAGAAGLSVLDLWWVPLTMLSSFLAGWSPGRAREAALALLVAVVAGSATVCAVPSWITLGERFVAVLVGGAMLPWFAGRFWRQYRDLVRAGWERAEHLEREQRLVGEQARLRERARIAQDMHDLLGHELSLVALSAGALKLAPDLPDEHRGTAGQIRAHAAAAVDRLGEVIGILRQDAVVSRPSDVAGLVDGAKSAGLTVTLRTEGEPGSLPAVAEHAVHRVVQEALTNAAKHAPGAAVAVRIRYGAAETEVSVENGAATDGAATDGAATDGAATEGAATDGGAAAPGVGGGYGLVGLEERVRLAGGWITYGPHEDGFAVTARIPNTPRTAPAPVAAGPVHEEAGRVPWEHRRARRRLGRTTLAAVAVPLAVIVLLGAGLRGWDLLLIRATVLPAADYARIQLGQQRAELAPALPEHQMPDHPADDLPPAPGTRCEYYAMTANPLDDRSGDAYRLCFRAGRLVSKQVMAQ